MKNVISAFIVCMFILSACTAHLAPSPVTGADQAAGKLEGKFVFNDAVNAYNQVFISDTDGENRKQITFETATDTGPSFCSDMSKDRRTVLFTHRINGAGISNIYSVDSEGTNKRLITGSNTIIDYSNPVFSPDGNYIYASGQSVTNSVNNIYRMNSDGSNPVPLNNLSGYWFLTSISPDGSKLAFQYNPPYPVSSQEIYTMNSDGSGLTALTAGESYSSWPLWSPVGSEMVFTGSRNGNFAIYKMGSDGTNVRIVPYTYDAEAMSWSPDGRYIVFKDIVGMINIVSFDGIYLKTVRKLGNGPINLHWR